MLKLISTSFLEHGAKSLAKLLTTKYGCTIIDNPKYDKDKGYFLEEYVGRTYQGRYVGQVVAFKAAAPPAINVDLAVTKEISMDGGATWHTSLSGPSGTAVIYKITITNTTNDSNSKRCILIVLSV